MKILVMFSTEECERIMATTWAIWRCRNLIVWNDKRMSPVDVIHMAAWAITEWKEVKQPSLEPRRSTTCRQWHKPPRNFVKLIIDASFFSDSLQTGVGMVVRNEDGVFMNARTILHDELLRTDDGEA